MVDKLKVADKLTELMVRRYVTKHSFCETCRHRTIEK